MRISPDSEMEPGALGLSVIGITAVGVFAACSRAAAEGNVTARALAIGWAALLMAGAGLAVFVAVYLLDLKCRHLGAETCQAEPAPWDRTDTAWQWWGQLVVALLGFAALLGALTETIRRRYAPAVSSVTLAALFFAAWTVFLAPLGDALGV